MKTLGGYACHSTINLSEGQHNNNSNSNNKPTCWNYDPLPPSIYYIVPSLVVTDTIQSGHLGFAGSEHETSMFEGDNISRLWIPSLCKLCCSCWCFKSNPVWPLHCKDYSWKQIKYGYLQFTFPCDWAYLRYNSCLGVSILLLSTVCQFLFI